MADRSAELEAELATLRAQVRCCVVVGARLGAPRGCACEAARPRIGARAPPPRFAGLPSRPPRRPRAHTHIHHPQAEAQAINADHAAQVRGSTSLRAAGGQRPARRRPTTWWLPFF